jgi:hypothetical protein
MPNPDINDNDFSHLSEGGEGSAFDAYSDHYKQWLPQTDFVPCAYADILDADESVLGMDLEQIGWLYVWVGQLSGLIKLGYSMNPDHRLIQARASSGEAIFEILRVEATPLAEAMIHREMTPFRHHGEWYYPHPELINWIHDAYGHGGY